MRFLTTESRLYKPIIKMKSGSSCHGNHVQGLKAWFHLVYPAGLGTRMSLWTPMQMENICECTGQISPQSQSRAAACLHASEVTCELHNISSISRYFYRWQPTCSCGMDHFLSTCRCHGMMTLKKWVLSRSSAASSDDFTCTVYDKKSHAYSMN